MKKQFTMSAYSVMAILGTLIVSMSLTILIALHAVKQSEQKFCAIVLTMTNGYRQSPPTTATGKNVSERMEALRKSLDCEGDQL